VKQRLDISLVKKGLTDTRQKAQGHIMAGEVRVDGNTVTKAGFMVSDDATVEVVSGKMPFVSRGGLKLDAAIDHFGIDVSDKTAMDIGASTGGFTDCLLQRGARKVYAIDVGYGLIDAGLRNDERVAVVERTNFRYIERDIIPECVDIVTVDVSFISVTKIIPRALEFLCQGGIVMVLVKPQFEVGKGKVGKGGIVRDETLRSEAVDMVKESMSSLGLISKEAFESPVKGQKGNREYFICLERGRNG
jgi:23S rRNA (cytidine1920-2'-O)/16S rRNA (cytidine1409-2'-O)-methyltransferase